MSTTTFPAEQATSVSVTIDDDATPVVRLIGRTLRDAVRLGHAPDVLGRGTGTVAVHSHATPQAATVTFSEGAVTVTGGVFAPTDASVTVDLHSRFACRAEDGDGELAAAVLRVLHVPLPDWRDAATRFWDITRGIRGVPDVLVAVATGPHGREEARFGTGVTTYRMVGTPDALAGVFTGADFLFTALERGLGVQGSMAQLSAMTAASWKARYDV
ncbi:putative protein OS=Tsukamurella paurometabola (strain ATCC 8368 / DSM / CCUG 35730 /CIP 100753 / JCM 10117 / KCTC 9821 / NBRC 16120 / NCIMB 702349/ NCTC 13040) OX=521096 GN=Tpau_2889 PE=4 SV=1 [Tsukamurella paurometabola]|uniref:Uncharacterized protein n=1 Tax=Tsukamurella paurometabola (strain ATCC 8368 / DSM 20162 / CCUG 35730 / CIP 100753 / JCM 10117 / KCTC 9821 / NBRC 16120 / NCIMB 702349 / NCTC 13040) TaxID=521096 RepID=D5UTY4_TSUPD|nr:hypothetical protein [Tsukamurella paurometabola]ADG79487.1 conserved hypothetical protein [Tsukamurella paurometabola DSM 20162]SUP35947.1 Uncharacterised protein [Tsukamurella paurometabola]